MIQNSIVDLIIQYDESEHYSYETKLEIDKILESNEIYFFQTFDNVYTKHHSESDLLKIIEETHLLSEYFKDWHVKTNNTFDSTTEKGFHFNSGSKDLSEFLHGNGNLSAGEHTINIQQITDQKLLIDAKNHIVRMDIVAEKCFEKDCDLKFLKKEFPLKSNKKMKK